VGRRAGAIWTPLSVDATHRQDLPAGPACLPADHCCTLRCVVGVALAPETSRAWVHVGIANQCGGQERAGWVGTECVGGPGCVGEGIVDRGVVEGEEGRGACRDAQLIGSCHKQLVPCPHCHEVLVCETGGSGIDKQRFGDAVQEVPSSTLAGGTAGSAAGGLAAGAECAHQPGGSVLGTQAADCKSCQGAQGLAPEDGFRHATCRGFIFADFALPSLGTR